MNALFPIHKKYSDLIFSGEKTLEFRNKKIKVNDGDKIFVYETKAGGIGMVVGYFICGHMWNIPKHKVGTYSMLTKYVDKYGSDEEKKAVHDAMEVHFDEYDDCLVLSYLFNDDIINCMKHTHAPVESIQMWQPSTLEIREANKEKATKLLDKCDEWLTRIGFYNEYDESNWKYAIDIKEPHKSKEPLPITDFYLTNGKKLMRAPQSFCYIQNLE